MMDWNLNTRSEWEWDNMKNMQFSTHDQNQTQENVDFSFSPSADSSSKFGDLPKDFLEKDESSSSWIRENGTTCLISTMVEEEEASTVFSGDAMIGLKLGRHASSSNTCRSNSETTATTSSVSLSSSSPMIKRSRSASYLSSRCQVEGCNLDLSSSKDYHRRHRICAHHSKSPTVVVAGMERRFCQQCSRFHDLSEFDDRKRSCRRRLSAHNARRRRPQSEEIQFGSSSICGVADRRPQMNFLLNRASMVACRDSVPPESSCDSLLGLAKGGGMPTNNGAVHFGSERFMTRSINHNGTMDATSNSILSGDVRNAFSLLSTSSWPSNWPEEPSSFDQFGQLNSISLSQPQIPLELQISTNTNTNQLQNLHSFRSPREFERFYSN